MSKYVMQTKSGKSISAYVILSKNHKKVLGKILVHHGRGRTFCNIWIDGYVSKDYPKNTSHMLYGQASGYGYNKEDAAIAQALSKVTYKLTDKWLKDGCRYETEPFKFDYVQTSMVDSGGAKALEEVLGCVVMQAI